MQGGYHRVPRSRSGNHRPPGKPERNIPGWSLEAGTLRPEAALPLAVPPPLMTKRWFLL
jgi:hypothetical protein